MRLAAPAAGLRCPLPDRASALHRMVRRGLVGEAPPGRARPARRRRRDRLVKSDRRRRESARQKRGSLTGPNPVDRGKAGSKIHVLSDRNGLPLALGVSAANMHDSQAFESLIQAIPKARSPRGPRRRKPAKVHADKAYDIPRLPSGTTRTGHRRPQRPPRHRILDVARPNTGGSSNGPSPGSEATAA